MIHITINLNPLALRSVSDKNFPTVKDFKILDVLSADCGFSVFAATPAENVGLAIFSPGLIKLFHFFSVPLRMFLLVFLKPFPLS